MGWYHTQGASKKDIVNDIINESFFRNEEKGVTSKCLRHCVKGNVLWLLNEYSYDDGKVDKWIGCYLLRSDKGYGWGYKPMNESFGPYYYSCPLSYLEEAPVACEEWRAGVREYHEKVKLSRNLQVGQKVRLTKDAVIPEVTIYSKKPLVGYYDGNYYRVKTKLIDGLVE